MKKLTISILFLVLLACVRAQSVPTTAVQKYGYGDPRGQNVVANGPLIIGTGNTLYIAAGGTLALNGNVAGVLPWSILSSLPSPAATFTGDATGSLTLSSSGTGSGTLTLSSSGVFPSTYGDSSHSPVVTFDGKGRATAASQAAITPVAIGALASSNNLSDLQNVSSARIHLGLVVGTNVAPATAGSAILYGNGAGGFSSASIGSGLTFTGGTLSAAGGLGTVTSITAGTGLTGGTITTSGTIGLAAAYSGNGVGTTNGILRGNGSGTVSAVTIGSGVSFVGGTLSATGTGGTVTSAALTMPGPFTVSGSPVTGSGTLAVGLATEPVNTFWAGPSTGSATVPTFRTILSADVPSINLSASGNGGVFGNLPITNLASGTGATAATYWRGDGSWGTPAGTGTVTSVGLALPAVFSVTGSPVTGAGTLTASFATQTPNQIFGGPTSGSPTAPTFRSLVSADLPAVNLASSSAGGVTGNLPVTNLNSGTAASAATFWRGDGTWSTPAGAGTVTQVALTAPAIFTVTGSPISAAGTLAITSNTQTANTVLSGPSSGAAAIPTFRALATADIPAVSSIIETSGPTTLTISAIASGQFLKRSGSSVASAALATVATSGAYADLSGKPDLTNMTVTSIQGSIAAFDLFKFNPELGYPSGGAVALDFSDKNNVYIPLTVNATFSSSSLYSGGTIWLTLKNTTGSTLTLAWPGSWSWSGSSAPSSITAGASLTFLIFSYGTTDSSVFAMCNTGATGSISVAPTMAAMRGLSGLGSNSVVKLLGYYAPGDGGGGDFYWDSSSTATDDSGTIIALTGVGTGRLKRIAVTTSAQVGDTLLDVRWFGAIPDFATDCVPHLATAYAAIPSGGNGTLFFPAGNYLWNTKLSMTDGTKHVTIRGSGQNGTRFLYNQHTQGMLICADQVEIEDVSFVNIDGTTSNPYVVLNLYGAKVTVHDVHFDSFYNVICLKLSGAIVQVHDVTATNIDGTQLWAEGCGGLITNCHLSAGNGSGLSVAPCVVIKGVGGGPTTSLEIGGRNIFRGAGPWASYDGGTAQITVLLTNSDGTVNEGSISGVLIDTTSGVGEPANSIGILFDGRSNVYPIGGWVVSDIYGNAAQETIRIHGQDSGGSKNIGGITCSNIYTLPSQVGAITNPRGIHIIEAQAIQVNGVYTRGNGGGTGVVIDDGGTNATQDINVTGMFSNSNNPTAVGIAINGANVHNVTARFTATSASVAPYQLNGGASKTNGLAFEWPNGAGGTNFSGGVNVNQ